MMEVEIGSLFDVSGKVVVVSGGGRGIGEMISSTFVAAGVERIYLASRSKVALESTAMKLNKIREGSCHIIEADLSTVEGCQKVASVVASKEKAVHVLVNNSGATWGAPIESFPEKGWNKVMDLNVKGLFFLTQALLPLLKAGATKEDPSRVINIGSVNGENIPFYEAYSYSASKAAVHHLTRHLASRLAHDNITVNAIAAGPFPTKMLSFIEETNLSKGVPLSRVGSSTDIGGACIFLSSKASSWITGVTLPVDGGVLVKASI
uniref:Uncharacterized protein n=1 Tax=Arcella intermedia TaxID=1963864 RepID=A0A6B2LE53_9EUKA